MHKRPDLTLIRGAATPAAANVIHISGIRSHVAPVPSPIAPQWPREHSWRDLVRRLAKTSPPRKPGDEGR